VKNDYGTEEEGRALNGLEEPLKKKIVTAMEFARISIVETTSEPFGNIRYIFFFLRQLNVEQEQCEAFRIVIFVYDIY
jgi:hypothetical protein